MESHFERVLASADAPSKRSDAPTARSPPAKRVRMSPDASAAQVAALVDRAEAQEGDSLDARSLKSMTNTLRKLVRRNALEREKHADEPVKFLDSELALDQELTRWKQVAARPELFPVMAELEVPRMLLGLFAHENLDIRLAILSLLSEFTDVDEAVTSLEPTRDLAKHLVDEKLLPLLVTNLYQLAAAVKSEQEQEEEVTGIYNSLQILENLADLEPQMCAQVAETTAILPFLLAQVAPGRVFSQNKLYASEILSILLQSGAGPREKFVAWLGKPRPSDEVSVVKSKNDKDKKVDLIDELLQALAPYRKKDPSNEEEEELVANLVNSLCSVLLVSEAQKQFRRLEGLELLLRCMKDRHRLVFGGALRALDHALMGNARSCERLIEIGGLRTVFSVFMGKHGKFKSSSSTKTSKAAERAKEEENAASLVTSLCAWVRADAPADGYDRLHAKFMENDMEKVDRLVDIFVKYHERVERSSHLDEEEDEEEEDEDSRYLRRLDAGLFVLERVAFVVAHLCRFSKKLRAYVMVKFHERNVDSESLTIILREQLDLLIADESSVNEKDSAVTNDVVNDEAKEAQKTQLRQLLEALETEEDAHKEKADENDVKEQQISTSQTTNSDRNQ
ncbi:Beta-catenin-like protein 1 [Phytophthora boehmeriae]|uniref:Beta-catenin-like protein 1 n=1 Tax=Phytophthora boehmeriae TaxID=109152 RepID=A0A8T1WLU7_9STRA|nr:Beta-catenin-like protein 1 [Phytophthora boehmeriae]